MEQFGEPAVALFTVDYLVEHDDRHWGNYGFMRNTDTGDCESISPYYDFDWIWSDGVVQLPDNAIANYGELIRNLCIKAIEVSGKFERGEIITKRANELIEQVEKSISTRE